MNYELANKLKEAGFPQNAKDLINQVEYRGEVYVKPTEPTLSELIEACPKTIVVDEVVLRKHFCLYCLEDLGWYAGYMHDDSWLDGDDFQNGSTPEEAVANLYLSLYAKAHTDKA